MKRTYDAKSIFLNIIKISEFAGLKLKNSSKAYKVIFKLNINQHLPTLSKVEKSSEIIIQYDTKPSDSDNSDLHNYLNLSIINIRVTKNYTISYII